MTELETWLEERGLGRYAKTLAENDVDLEILPQLSDTDLKDLGLSLGHRRKLLAALCECAAEAPSDAAARASAQAPLGADEDVEQRQITVMFCDLVGSTELAEQLEPEDLRDVLRHYHDMIATVVAGWDGHVGKLLGDGVLAFFGWPNAHETQAEMAVRAGLATAREVAKLKVAEKPLAVRVGIATGSVVIGDMTGKAFHESGSVVGSTPNLAARLQALARPGEVLIDEGTRRLTQGAFFLDQGTARRIKGFTQPVRVWRVQAMEKTDSRFDALHRGGLTTFFGRKQEVELLKERWRRAWDGEGQAVLLVGEAGIGKSRILHEATAHLKSEAHRILRYQCSPHEVNAAFHPIVAEIETAAGFHPDDAPETRLGKLETHLAEVLEASDEEVALFATLLGLPLAPNRMLEMAPQRLKQRTLALLMKRIAGFALRRPLLMLIEDIHWIDASSLEFLDLLVEDLPDLPVLCIMTSRPEFAARWQGYGHVTNFSLNRLGRGDARAIAERVAGGKALPEEVLDRIVAHADGIALFVEELTKAILEAGFLEERSDRFILPGPLPKVAIPTTLKDSLMARLDRLAPVKRVIQAAACIGREFDAGLLAAALSMERAELDRSLEQLLVAELIFRRGGAEQAQFIFKHALVQDAAYGSLLASARQKLHEKLALTLERTADPEPLELARHFAAAGDNGRAAGLYLDAGRRSLATNALPEAIGALELGLRATEALAPSDDRKGIERDMRVALGAARMAHFGWAHPAVAEALEPAFPLAQATGEPDALCSTLWGLWVHYQTRTDFPRAHEWLARMQEAAQLAPESDLPVIHRMSAGCQCFWEGDYRQAIALTDDLRKIYRPERHARLVSLTNHDPLAFAQHWAGSLADWISGSPERTVDRLDEAIAVARRIGHPFNLVFALTAGATSLLYLGETARLLANCDEAETVVRDEALGAFSEHVNVMQWRGGALVQAGDFEAGYKTAKKGNDFWNESGGRICNAMFRSWLVGGLRGLGRVAEAERLNRQNLAHCRETGDRFMEPECLRLQGELLLEQAKTAPRSADHASAEQSFREAIAVARGQGARSWELRAAMSLARLLHRLEREAEALQCLEPLLGGFREGGESQDLRQAQNLLAELS